MKKLVGPGVVVRASDYVGEIARIPTGILALDLATGGGFPQGRISIIAGRESSCKSAIAYRLIASAQASGQTAALIDIEQSLTASWAKVFGLDMEKLIVSYPETMEAAFTVVDALTAGDGVDLVVVDSMAALSPEEEREKTFEEGERRAERAKITNRFLRILTSNLQPQYDRVKDELRHSTKTAILIQQLRRDPSSRYFVEYMPAGQQQLFQSSLTLYLRRASWLTEVIEVQHEDETIEDERTVGLEVRWKIEKSKVSPAQREGIFRFFTENTLDGQYFQGQILETQELIHLGQMWGIVKKKGSWYTLDLGEEQEKVQGEQAMTQLFAEHGEAFVQRLLERMEDASKQARKLPERPVLPNAKEALDTKAEDAAD